MRKRRTLDRVCLPNRSGVGSAMFSRRERRGCDILPIDSYGCQPDERYVVRRRSPRMRNSTSRLTVGLAHFVFEGITLMGLCKSGEWGGTPLKSGAVQVPKEYCELFGKHKDTAQLLISNTGSIAVRNTKVLRWLSAYYHCLLLHSVWTQHKS